MISGTLYVGFGERLDEAKLKALPPGSFWTESANVPHFLVVRARQMVAAGIGRCARPAGPQAGLIRLALTTSDAKRAGHLRDHRHGTFRDPLHHG